MWIYHKFLDLFVQKDSMSASIPRIWREHGGVVMQGKGSFPGEGRAWAEQGSAVDKPLDRVSQKRRWELHVARGLVTNWRKAVRVNYLKKKPQFNLILLWETCDNALEWRRPYCIYCLSTVVAHCYSGVALGDVRISKPVGNFYNNLFDSNQDMPGSKISTDREKCS